MPSNRRRDKLREKLYAEICLYEDRELVERAAIELEQYASRLGDGCPLEKTREDLRQATKEFDRLLLLSDQNRRQLRRFVLMKRLEDRQPLP